MKQEVEIVRTRPVEMMRAHLLEAVAQSDPKFGYLPRHLHEVERWVGRELSKHPEASSEVIFLAVWGHDIGQVVGDPASDHAINSEAEVRRFLPEVGVEEDIVERVAHCVRSHRCRDVQLESIEAKILAACDSASHMTDTVYADMASRGEAEQALAKLERDLRDLNVFPDLQEETRPLYDAWKNLLNVFIELQ